jgi:hypothetical protein
VEYWLSFAATAPVLGADARGRTRLYEALEPALPEPRHRALPDAAALDINTADVQLLNLARTAVSVETRR